MRPRPVIEHPHLQVIVLLKILNHNSRINYSVYFCRMQCIIVFYKNLKVQQNRVLPDLPPPSPLDPAIPNVYDEVTGEHVFPVNY